MYWWISNLKLLSPTGFNYSLNVKRHFRTNFDVALHEAYMQIVLVCANWFLLRKREFDHWENLIICQFQTRPDLYWLRQINWHIEPPSNQEETATFTHNVLDSDALHVQQGWLLSQRMRYIRRLNRILNTKEANSKLCKWNGVPHFKI